MMTLYSGNTCPYSHRCRFALYEKGMDFQVIDVDLSGQMEDLAVINPYNRVPVMVERELVLYEANIINEYVDERFPHPQLMPADPVTRARVRLLLFNFEEQFFKHIEVLDGTDTVAADHSRMVVGDGLTQLAPMFSRQQYMLGEDFSMLDVAIAPLLWRLSYYGIELPKQATSLLKYAERIFSRNGYIDAMTPAEKAMRR